jgi:hypothetical protein
LTNILVIWNQQGFFSVFGQLLGVFLPEVPTPYR